MKKTLSICASAIMAVTALTGCGGDNGAGPDAKSKNNGYSGKYGYFDYKGKSYRTVVIGNQTWMVENLYYNSEPYRDLYTWDGTMNIGLCNTSDCPNRITIPHQGECPEGWHIPTYGEWNDLWNYGEATVRHMNPTAALMSQKGWYDYSGYEKNGTNELGFEAQPTGSCSDIYDRPSCEGAGQYACWWSASLEPGMPSTAQTAYAFELTGETREGYHVFHFVTVPAQRYGCSVRCVQDK